MKTLKSRAAILILFLWGGSLLLQGCAALVVGGAAAGAGAATVAYIKGELQTTYAASLNRAWEASLEALKDLKIEVVSIQKDRAGGVMEGVRADGTKVKVSLKPAGPDTTSVTIRIGIFGDRDASMEIHRRIETRLRMEQKA